MRMLSLRATNSSMPRSTSGSASAPSFRYQRPSASCGRSARLAGHCSASSASRFVTTDSGSGVPSSSAKLTSMNSLAAAAGSLANAAATGALPVLSVSATRRWQVSCTCAGSALPLPRCAASRSLSTSPASRKASIMSRRKASSPLRMRSSKFSSTWVTSARSVKPKVPAEPLIECAARNTALSCSASGFSMSRSSNRASMPSRCS